MDTCANCGCPSVIAPIDLEPPRVAAKQVYFLQEPGTWWVMFPEMPIAAVLLLAAPVWAISLILSQHFFAAVFLLAAAGGLGYALYRAVRANQKWGAYAAVIGILMVGGLVASTT